MTHEPEFHKPAPRDADKTSRELAGSYARVLLSTEDGRRVLADLRRKFGLQRLCFQRTEGSARYDYLSAAITDGERRVLSEIEGALRLGAADQGLAGHL